MPLPPFLAGILRFVLIGLGAMAVLSAVVNIIGAIRLIEPADEEALGLSRNLVVAEYSVQLLLGAAMLYFGFRRRK